MHHYPPELAQLLEKHFLQVGASREVPIDADARRAFFRLFMDGLVIDNIRFPDDLPILAVLQAFFLAVLNGQAKPKGFNVRTYIEAFNEWWPSAAGQFRARLAAPPKAMLAERTPLSHTEQRERLQQTLANIQKLRASADRKYLKAIGITEGGVLAAEERKIRAELAELEEILCLP